MKEWASLSLSLSLSVVGLRAFKLDRVQVRPMADVAKLPCDSGFTLSRLVRLAVALSAFRLLSERKREWREKNGEKLSSARLTVIRRASESRG